jgi:hypothetical protein
MHLGVAWVQMAVRGDNVAQTLQAIESCGSGVVAARSGG